MDALKILIVEDDQSQWNEYKKAAAREWVEMTLCFAHSWALAISRIESDAPDVIVLSYDLSGHLENSLEILRYLMRCDLRHKVYILGTAEDILSIPADMLQLTKDAGVSRVFQKNEQTATELLHYLAGLEKGTGYLSSGRRGIKKYRQNAIGGLLFGFVLFVLVLFSLVGFIQGGRDDPNFYADFGTYMARMNGSGRGDERPWSKGNLIVLMICSVLFLGGASVFLIRSNWMELRVLYRDKTLPFLMENSVEGKVS